MRCTPSKQCWGKKSFRYLHHVRRNHPCVVCKQPKWFQQFHSLFHRSRRILVNFPLSFSIPWRFFPLNFLYNLEMCQSMYTRQKCVAHKECLCVCDTKRYKLWNSTRHSRIITVYFSFWEFGSAACLFECGFVEMLFCVHGVFFASPACCCFWWKDLSAKSSVRRKSTQHRAEVSHRKMIMAREPRKWAENTFFG